MKLVSSEFRQGESIPNRYTCEGDNISPPLSWSDPPDGTRSFALVVDDPDAPDPAAPKRVFSHWVLYNLPSSFSDLPEGVQERQLGKNVKQGRNDVGDAGYTGPCPPIGRHRYFFKLYALDTMLDETGTPTKATLESAMRGHVLASAELMGTYEKRV